MNAGFVFTEFPILTEKNGIYHLKCLSFLIFNTKYGAIIFDTGSPFKPEYLLHHIKKNFDLNVDDIKWVFNTHIHPDHCGANSLFKKSKIILSRKDFEFSEEIANVAFSNGNLLEFLHNKCPGYKNNFNEFDANNTKEYIKKYWSREAIGLNNNHSFIEDNPEIPDFIKIIPSFGHTFFHYSYQIDYNNKKIFITGDAISNRLVLKSDIKNRYIEPHMDFDAYFNTLDFFKNQDAIFVPGHDRPFDSKTALSIKNNFFNIE